MQFLNVVHDQSLHDLYFDYAQIVQLQVYQESIMQHELNADAMGCLTRLETATWFTRLGEPLNPDESDYVLAKDLTSAIASSKKRIWDEVLMECNNDNCELIFKHFPFVKSRIRHPNYNDYATTINGCVEQLIKRKQLNAPPEHQDAIASLSWVLHNCVMSSQFKEAIQTDFLDRLEKLILTGRYPCGWNGKRVDSGQVMIY